MRKRSQAREFALQILYQIDITRQEADDACGSFWLSFDQQPDCEVQEFTRQLVKGVMECRHEIDAKIAQYAKNWELERMAVVDRNILRLGGFEIIHRSDIPPKVSINEAVELAKKYSDIQAAKFVNGILDKIKTERAP
ncbi:MAG: transcription antitermination factor NusB [Candidatus Omnitrophica bacterium]|nr:transcription antitermination factor NusB [Candidatus Omnitrophota bacterium]